jgi:hypothetical protein
MSKSLCPTCKLPIKKGDIHGIMDASYSIYCIVSMITTNPKKLGVIKSE